MDSEVILEAVKENCLYLKIDDETVRVIYDSNGLRLSCICRNCSVVGIPRGTLCRRRLRAIHYLFKHSGSLSEIEVHKYDPK